jgi:hypothetical protein
MAENGNSVAILLGVYATLALDLYGTLNSSPQTTELFAGDREDTLMHWVVIGDVAAVSAGLIASAFADSKVAPIVATASIMVMMHLLYRHAVKRGQGKRPPDGASGY